MGGERTIVKVRPASSGGPEKGDESIIRTGASEDTANIIEQAGDDDPAGHEAYADPGYWESDAEHQYSSSWLLPTLFGVVALCWSVAAALGWYSQYGLTFPGVPALIAYIGIACVPLALCAILYVIVMQSSRVTTTRYAEAAGLLRQESTALSANINALTGRIDDQRLSLQQQTEAYSDLAEKFHRQIDDVSKKLGVDIAQLDERTGKLRDSATSVRADMAILLAGLPKAHSQTRAMTEDLKTAALTAQEQSAALQAQLLLLQQQAEQSNETANGAATRLGAQLSRMEDVGKATMKRLLDTSEGMTSSVEQMLAKANEAADQSRQIADQQASHMATLVEEHGTNFRDVGEEVSTMLMTRLSDISGALDDFASRLSVQEKAGRDMAKKLGSTIKELEDRLAALGQHGSQQFASLTASVEQLRIESAELDQGFAASEGRIDTLSERAETLLVALYANAREIDETLPAAFSRLSTMASESLEGINNRLPDLEQFNSLASTASERLDLASDVLSVQVGRVSTLMADIDAHLEHSAERVDDMIASIGTAKTEAMSLADEVAPKVGQSLLDVRAHSDEARDHAQKTLNEVVPQAHAAIANAVSQTLGPDLEALITARISEIESASQRAVEAAASAVNALQDDIDRLDATSQTIRERADSALGEVEDSSRDVFTRRVALLIEALNSTAIDVAKTFSVEVSDTAWAAYLKGDRGVFTRRAVKLLDAAEAKEIARRYEDDYQFRDLVSRYIHDFEAILRTVLTTRDGSPMAVTMLSSDMGKLYVALAQAIDRLRD